MTDLLIKIALACWDVLLDSAPYMLFGFLMAGVLRAFVPGDLVSRHLGRGRVAPVLKAAIFGAPLPLCSCGVVPVAAGLRKQGASRGATASFLIATPETGVDSMAVTWALLDPVMTVMRPLVAVFTAIVAGLVVDRAGGPDPAVQDPASMETLSEPHGGHAHSHGSDGGHSAPGGSCCDSGAACGCSSTPGGDGAASEPAGAPTTILVPTEAASGTGDSDGARSFTETPVEPLVALVPKSLQGAETPCDTDEPDCCCGGGCAVPTGDAAPKTAGGKLRLGLDFAFTELLGDIGPWFLIGVVLAGLVAALLPGAAIERYLGTGLGSMLAALLVAAPLYVCATASTPIVAALALKGLSPGAALVFLLAGPATNAASLSVVTRVIGRRSAAVVLGAILACALLAGMGANALYAALGLDLSGWVAGSAAETHGPLAVVSALVLLALIVRTRLPRRG